MPLMELEMIWKKLFCPLFPIVSVMRQGQKKKSLKNEICKRWKKILDTPLYILHKPAHTHHTHETSCPSRMLKAHGLMSMQIQFPPLPNQIPLSPPLRINQFLNQNGVVRLISVVWKPGGIKITYICLEFWNIFLF